MSKYNLTMLEERLSGDAKYRPIREQIRRVQSTESMIHEVDSIQEDIDLILEMLTSRGAVERPISDKEAIIERGTAMHAIISYCRSTDGSARSRATFDVRKVLSKEQMALHRRIIALRNDAIAHFGSGKDEDGDWYQEALILRDDIPGEFQFYIEFLR